MADRRPLHLSLLNVAEAGWKDLINGRTCFDRYRLFTAMIGKYVVSLMAPFIRQLVPRLRVDRILQFCLFQLNYYSIATKKKEFFKCTDVRKIECQYGADAPDRCDSIWRAQTIKGLPFGQEQDKALFAANGTTQRRTTIYIWVGMVTGVSIWPRRLSTSETKRNKNSSNCFFRIPV